VHEADKKAIAEYNKHKGESGYLPAVIGIGGKYLLEKALSKIKGKPSTFYGGKKHVNTLKMAKEQLISMINNAVRKGLVDIDESNKLEDEINEIRSLKESRKLVKRESINQKKLK